MMLNLYLYKIDDQGFELYKEFSDEGNAAFLSRGVRKTIEKSDLVITISDNAKREIIDFYNLPEKSVKTATPATDPGSFYRRSKMEVEEVKHKYGIEGEYILALSNLEPRKNLGALVEAYCSLPKKQTEKLSLLLVGVSGWKTEALFDYIVKKVDGGANIIRPSKYVSDADKPAIISGAKLLVYPSHYEGFGMPPLEALACGVPVIVANNSSLPQAVGGAGILLRNSSVEELTDTIIHALNNLETLTNRTIIDGPLQARKFSWDASASVYLDAAKELN